MALFSVLPLMIVPVVIYNVIAFGGATFSSADAVRASLNEPFYTITMAKGAEWIITPGHALIALSLVMLFFELIKATAIGRSSVMNHAFSLVLFVICLVEFLMFNAFATSIFFLIMLMTLMDVMAGFIVTTNSARRDFAISDGGFAD